MLQTLIFDLGNVLIFFDHSKMVRQLAAFCGIQQEEVKNLLDDKKTGLAYEKGAISSRDLFQLFCIKSSRTLDFQGLMHAGASIFSPNDLLLSYLPRFKEKKIRLLLLSNTCEMHFDYVLKNFSFLSYFDSLVLSYKVGSVKPEEAIYKEALREARCPKEACLFVDDMPENIRGAEKLGIPSHHFKETTSFLEALTHQGIVHHDD